MVVVAWPGRGAVRMQRSARASAGKVRKRDEIADPDRVEAERFAGELTKMVLKGVRRRSWNLERASERTECDVCVCKCVCCMCTPQGDSDYISAARTVVGQSTRARSVRGKSAAAAKIARGLRVRVCLLRFQAQKKSERRPKRHAQLSSCDTVSRSRSSTHETM